MTGALRALWQRWTAPPPAELQALWNRIAAAAREPRWYLDHGVPDTLDGRFDMVALLASLVMLRLEDEGLRQEGVWLTERFVADMDGSLRQMGVGDLVVGKQVGRMVGALGGRLGAYREALAAADRPRALAGALQRNLYRSAEPPGKQAKAMAAAILTWNEAMRAVDRQALLEGRL